MSYQRACAYTYHVITLNIRSRTYAKTEKLLSKKPAMFDLLLKLRILASRSLPISFITKVKHCQCAHENSTKTNLIINKSQNTNRKCDQRQLMQIFFFFLSFFFDQLVNEALVRDKIIKRQPDFHQLSLICPSPVWLYYSILNFHANLELN